MPLAEVADGLMDAVGPVENDEALHLQALRQHTSEVPRARRWRRCVVRGDQSAERDAAKGVHQRQDGIENLSADVLEVDIDALRARRLEVGRQIARLVVNGSIEPEFVDQILALLRPACDADGTATFELRDLRNNRADGARRGRYHDGFTRLRLADLEQAEIRSPARHPQSADPALQWSEAGVDLDHPIALREGILLDAEQS